MSPENEQLTCPICSTPIQSSPHPLESRFDMFDCECLRCGKFRYAPNFLSGEKFQEVRNLVSAWVYQQNKNGVRRPQVPGDLSNLDAVNHWYDGLKFTGFPQSATEKLDALLLVYAEMCKDDIDRRIKPKLFPFLPSSIAAKDFGEVGRLNELLAQKQYIELSPEIRIQVEGWRRIDELRDKPAVTDSAFVAMWFDNTTTDYRAAVIKAIQYSGYKPIIIDQTQFNGFIMEQIMASIRTARFVIADFTCLPESIQSNEVKCGIRGGVYWEAGMAFGLNKSVIHTCKNDVESKKRLHFNIAQYSTIFWNPENLTGDIGDLTQPINNPNFPQTLAQRILGTIGSGSVKTL